MSGPPASSSQQQNSWQPDPERCSGCRVGRYCIAASADDETLRRLDGLLEVQDAIETDATVIRKGDPFAGLFAVRDGCFKSFVLDRDGREQVLGFHFSGELIGLDAIASGEHLANVVALGPSALCQLEYDELSEISSCSSGLQQQLFRLFSGRLADQHWRTGDFTAAERLAVFLLDISARLQRRGGDGAAFELLMSRSDIGNYLGLATETVSRVFSRFRRSGYITVHRKQVTLADKRALQVLASGVTDAA